MDQLLELMVLLVTLWRITLGAVIGLGIAFLVSLLFPQLPPGAWFALGFLGAATGVVWHAAVHSPSTVTTGQKLSATSKLIAFLAVAALGGLWGTLVESAVGTPAAIACLFVTPALLGPILGALSKEQVTVSSIALATVASLLGFFTPYAIGLLFQAGA